MTITITESTLPTSVSVGVDNGIPTTVTSTVPAYVAVAEFVPTER